MQLGKTEFAQGENITIRLSLKNISNKTITLRWGDYYGGVGGNRAVFDFLVTDVNGALVYQFTKAGYFSFCMEWTETLKPGDQIGCTYVWYQITSFPERALVPKGTYHVKGSTRPMSLTIDGQTSSITLETPTITFTIK